MLICLPEIRNRSNSNRHNSPVRRISLMMYIMVNNHVDSLRLLLGQMKKFNKRGRKYLNPD